MSRILTLATWTMVELLRERVLYVVLLFGLLLVASSSILTPLAPGAQKKIVADFGLAAIDLLGVLVILLTGSTLIRREIDRRSLDVVLSKPISRLEYLVGKCLGLVITLLVLMLAMTGLFALTLVAAGFEWHARYLLAVGMAGLEILVVASLAVLFSTFTSPTLAALFTLALFAAGRLAQDFLHLSQQAASRPLIDKLLWLVPALGVFDVRADVVYAAPVPAARIVLAVAYAGITSLTLLYVAAWIFRRRDFR